MKRIVTALATAALLAAGAQSARAGDREWATAGKILTGVIAGAVIAKSFEPAPAPAYAYTYPATTVVAPAPVVVQPAPVIYQPAPVYYHPAPVVVCPPAPRVVVVPAPVYYAPVPVPVVRHHYSFGHRAAHRVCW